MTAASVVKAQGEADDRGASVFLFTLAAYQYGVVHATVFTDIRLGPASLQVVAVTLMFVGCAIIRRQRVAEVLGWQALIVLGLGLVFVPFKMLTGLLHPAGLQGVRLFFILPLVWGVYAAYVTGEATRRAVATIIIWNCVFVAVFGLVHFFFFPTVFFSTTASDAYYAGNISSIPGHSAEAAFVGNPSSYGAILVTGMFAICLARRRSLPYMLAFVVMTLATYLSVSRAASLFATVLLVLYLAGGISWKRPQGVVLVLVLVSVGVYVVLRKPFFLLAMQYAAGRFGIFGSSLGAVADRLTAGRLPEFAVGLQLMCRDMSHIFLGSADTESWIIGDVGFSDNSFIILALGFGVPLAALWIVTVLRRTIPVRFPLGLIRALLLLFLYSTLFTTPSLNWDMWLVYAVGLQFVSRESRLGSDRFAETIRAGRSGRTRVE